MNKIVARFYVSGLTKRPDGSAQVDLQAVSSKENARWSQYTPSGSLTMNLTRKASGARKAFEAIIEEAAQGTRRPECLVTLDFDVAPGEAPERAKDEAGQDIGYASDE